MKQSYERAFFILCGLEGYVSDVKGDPGGYTIWGITERYFPDDVAKMKGMSADESKQYAMEFYRRHFWDAIKADDLPVPLDTIAFCQSVNIMAATKKILAETQDWKDFLFKCQSYYSRLVQEVPEKGKFFRGWINRTLSLWLKFRSQVEG